MTHAVLMISHVAMITTLRAHLSTSPILGIFVVLSLGQHSNRDSVDRL